KNNKSMPRFRNPFGKHFCIAVRDRKNVYTGREASHVDSGAISGGTTGSHHPPGDIVEVENLPAGQPADGHLVDDGIRPEADTASFPFYAAHSAVGIAAVNVELFQPVIDRMIR